MKSRDKLKRLLAGDPAVIAELKTPRALSGVWFGATRDGHRLYQTAEGERTIEELTKINEDRRGNWQVIDLGPEPEDGLLLPVAGVGRPLAKKADVIAAFFAVDE